MSGPDTARCPHCFEATNANPCPYCGWQLGQDNPPPALALGRVLDGRYRVGRVLGHGGFGITYLAWDDNLQLRLAIKEYLPRDCVSRAPDGVSLAVYSGQAGEQFAYGLDRFLEEARTLAHFDQHPGIVTVKNFFRAHGTGYCVMDYVAGITLRQYLDQQPGGRISVEAALRLLTPVMDALRAVHKEGLLHRDLAPDNIYLTQDGRIKLLDFGAARFAASEHSKSLSIILKPGYAPEEQYRSKGKQGPWTDVYGLAATFYRAITGAVPPEALDRTEEDELLPPSKQGIAIQPHQEAVLLKALAIKAPLRFQSISEFQQAWRTAAMPLSDSLAAAGAVEAATAPVTPAPGAANTGKSGLILALAGILALLAVAGAALWSDKPEPAPPMVAAPPPKPAQTVPAPPVPIMAPPSPEVTLAPAAPDTPMPPITTAALAVPTAPAAPESATAPAEKAGEPAIPQTPAKPGEKSQIYFAAEVAPTANAPPEAPLCYKFMVAGPEEQMRKLKAKYPGLYDDEIVTNHEGGKNLVAKRRDETGKEITYFYSTSPKACNDYQQNRLQSRQIANNEVGTTTTSPFAKGEANLTTPQSQFPYNDKSAKTPFGNLEIQKVGKHEQDAIFLGGKLLRQEDHINIANVFDLSGGVVAIIKSSCAGSGCLPDYQIITMKKNRQYSISEQFEANLNPISPRQEGDAIIIDLGWKNGKREFIKYIDGGLKTVTVLPPANLAPLSDEDCDTIYGIYESVMYYGECGVEHLGGVQGRNYEHFKHDPRLNLGEFELLTKSYCRSQVKTSKKQFRQRVCRG